jgi:solute carrier family 25 oxoglutarate transporter 11
VLPYKGIIDCAMKSIKNEGFLSMWVGIETYYFRVAPLSMISILVQDYLHDIVNKKKHE